MLKFTEPFEGVWQLKLHPIRLLYGMNSLLLGFSMLLIFYLSLCLLGLMLYC